MNPHLIIELATVGNWILLTTDHLFTNIFCQKGMATCIVMHSRRREKSCYEVCLQKRCKVSLGAYYSVMCKSEIKVFGIVKNKCLMN